MANTIKVSTQAELISALKTAQGGETILLEGGKYGDLKLIDSSKFDLTFSDTVTIKAANPDKPPVFTGLDMRNASKVSFEDITFDYTANPGAPLWILPFRVQGGSDLSFDGCTFDGSLATGLTEQDNGLPTGVGLAIGGVSGLSVTNSEFFHFRRALAVGGSDDVIIGDNEIHHVRMDGMTFSSVQGIVIENNHIHNFVTSPKSGDHADMIQFWTTNTTRPSTDIIIRDNVLDMGDGGLTQSIFMRNELVDSGKAGLEMYYQNVLIENNVIVNGHLHGITVGETAGLTIINNSVLHADGNIPDGRDSEVEIPRINVNSASTDVTVTHNVTSKVTGVSDRADWTVSENVFVQDQDANAPGWYGDVFVHSSLASQSGLHDFIAKADSVLVSSKAGATTIRDRDASVLDAGFNVSRAQDDLHTFTFDASASTGIVQTGTTYLWHFGDGSTATGQKVTHSYAGGDQYDVKLTVTLANKVTDSAVIKLIAEDPLVVRLDAKGGFVTSSAGEEQFAAANIPMDAAGNLQLGGVGAVAKISWVEMDRIFGQEDVTIDFRVAANSGGATGEIFRMHGSFIGSINANGEAQVQVWSSEGGSVKLASQGIKINDGKFHDVRLELDGGQLVLSVDGSKVADTKFSGTIADLGQYDLTFGSGWSKNLEGDLAAFSVNVLDETPMRSLPKSEGLQETPMAIKQVQPEADAANPAEASAKTEVLLNFNDAGNFVVQQDDVQTIVKTNPAVLSGGNLQLGGTKAVAVVDDALLGDMFKSEDVTVSFRVAADAPGGNGEIFRIHSSLTASINSNGEAQIQVWSQDGTAVRLISSGLKINDGSLHDVELQLKDGQIALLVDDKVVQSKTFAGTIADKGNYDLSFGTSWAKSLQGDLDSFQIGIISDDPLAASALSMDGPML